MRVIKSKSTPPFAQNTDGMRFDGRAPPIDRDVERVQAAGVCSSHVRPKPQILTHTPACPGDGSTCRIHVSVKQIPAAARGRPCSAPLRPWVSAPVPVKLSTHEIPPLAKVLHEAGLSHVSHKLVNDFAASTIEQLRELSSAEMDTLVDELRLRPGQRSQFLKFMHAERLRGSGRFMSNGKAQRNYEGKWRMTREYLRNAAGQRGRSAENGSHSDITNEPFLNWGRTKEEPKIKPMRPPRMSARTSVTHVLKVGRARVTMHGDRTFADRPI